MNEYENNQISNRLTELILDSAGEGIYGVDADGKTTFANPAALKMLGYDSPDALFGVSVYRVLLGLQDSDAPQIEISPINFALSEGETAHVNTETFFRQDGTSFLAEYICVPLKKREKLLGAVITFQDITERREVETAISAARDAALESAQVKAAFLANMSHEIRTPLNGILGLTEVLQKTSLNEEQENLVKLIKTSADSLLTIINDVLDFSKIEAGKLLIEDADFNLLDIIESTFNFFGSEARQKNINLKLEKAADVPHLLRGDAGRLRQIFNNLLSNALKFTERGSITLRVEKLPLKNENEVTLRFEVEDTGIGIESDILPKLFQPFTQGDVSTTRRFGGTGLGLSICRQLAGLMGGEIGAESEIGKGSKFWFTVKIKVQSQKPKVRNLESAESVKSLKIKNNGQRATNNNKKSAILVAEDNLINRQITLSFLREIGYTGETAETGAEAVSKFKTGNFSLILMDCQMPDLDGYDATREIRRLENGTKRTKIIAMTANVRSGEREKCLACGMDDYLAKPFSCNDLESILREHLPADFADNTHSEENTAIPPEHLFAELLEAEILTGLLEIEKKGSPNFIAETVALYLKHSDKLLTRLKPAFEKQDFDEIAGVAHSLKGSSASLGLREMSLLSEELETNAKQRNIFRVTENFKNIKTAFERIALFMANCKT